MGILTDKDAKMFRSYFKENAKLLGIEVLYRYPISSEISNHAEFSYELSDPIELNIIFDTNPTVSTLRKIGWVSENPNDKPYLAQLPYDTPGLRKGSVISITADNVSDTRDFKITSILNLLIYPDCYTCTLAPIFFNKETKPEYDDTNYNYIDTEEAHINRDAPNNNFEFLNIGE